MPPLIRRLMIKFWHNATIGIRRQLSGTSDGVPGPPARLLRGFPTVHLSDQPRRHCASSLLGDCLSSLGQTAQCFQSGTVEEQQMSDVPPLGRWPVAGAPFSSRPRAAPEAVTYKRYSVLRLAFSQQIIWADCRIQRGHSGVVHDSSHASACCCLLVPKLQRLVNKKAESHLPFCGSWSINSNEITLLNRKGGAGCRQQRFVTV
jgi:hypothetical protein